MRCVTKQTFMKCIKGGAFFRMTAQDYAKANKTEETV